MRNLSEAVSGYTHLGGAVLSVLGLVFLVTKAAADATPWHVVGFAVFGASLILLYAASTTYHLVSLEEEQKVFLRRIDHIMIYALIAGTYTPVCITALRGPWGWSILGVVWGLAVLGVLFKLRWFHAPRGLSTVLYVVMGWVALVALVPLLDAVGPGGVLWLLAGGIWYTLGAAAYALEKPTFHARHFTFHELFHVLVLLGSLSHFWFMYRYVLPAGG